MSALRRYAHKHYNELGGPAFWKKREKRFITTLKLKIMGAWIYPAVAAGMGIVNQVGNWKDNRQVKQQGRLNELEISMNDKMMGIQNEHALQFWKDTSYDAQKEQLNKAGLNPGLMYGMGGGGGQSIGAGGAHVSGGTAAGRSGRESEEGAAIGMQLMSQMELQKAQKENIEADTKNKQMDTLDKAESKDSKVYDNMVKDILFNRDSEGNYIENPEGDMNRVAVKEKVVNLIQQELKNKNIDEDTASIVARVAQGWEDLSIKDRQQKLNDLVEKAQLDNKDQDQIMGVINMILGAVTRGRFGGHGGKKQ